VEGVPRDFQQIEKEKLQGHREGEDSSAGRPPQDRIASLDKQIAAARCIGTRNASESDKRDDMLRSSAQGRGASDTRKRFQKAELDSQRSTLDGMIDRGLFENARRGGTSKRPSSRARRSARPLAPSSEGQRGAGRSTRPRGRSARPRRTTQKKREDLTRGRRRVKRVLEQKQQHTFGVAGLARGLPAST